MVNDKSYQELHPTNEQMEYARKQVCSSAYFQRADTRDATKDEQYYSFLAEVVIADRLNNPRPVLKKESDKGYDVDWFGTKIDVKCRRINVYPEEYYDVVVMAAQLKNPSPDHYFLFLGWREEQQVFYVLGINSTLGFKNTAELQQPGTQVCPGFKTDDEIYVSSIKHLARVSVPE